jgi:hypothetical protein
VNRRQDALAEIVAIARRNDLTSGEIVDALTVPTPGEASPDDGIVRRLLAYVGGIFVFAGVAVYIGMFWADMNGAARIIVTLGTGVTALTLAILLVDNDRLARAATPLFLIAAWLQPTGIINVIAAAIVDTPFSASRTGVHRADLWHSDAREYV